MATTDPKRPRGRPRNPDRGSVKVKRTIRLTPSHWIEFEARGGVKRLRELLDKPSRKPAA